MILTPEQYRFSCTCARFHRVLLEEAVIEPEALSALEDARQRGVFAGPVAAVYDENTWAAVSGRRPKADRDIILPANGLHADENGVDALETRLNGAGTLIAVGSGTIHDIVRYCAARRGIPFVSAPTAASMDGFTSAVAAMTWHGFKTTLPAVAPVRLYADLAVISRAPMRLTRSGVGDILGKYISLADWELAHLLTGEYYCDGIASLTRAAVDGVVCCHTGLLRDDLAAYEKLTHALVLSGVAMQLAGNSRPASGAEHHISHMLEIGTPLLGHTSALHGERVGVGTCICCRTYRQWAGVPAQDVERRPLSYTPLREADLQAAFGDLTAAILRENADDCLAPVSARAVVDRWESVRALLSGVPPADEIEGILKTLSAKHTPADILVEENKLPLLRYYSPLVRNRFTFLRLLRLLDSDVPGI